MADNGKARSQLFLASPDQPLDQASFLRVIDSGDAAAQQASSIVLALLIVVSGAHLGTGEEAEAERAMLLHPCVFVREYSQGRAVWKHARCGGTLP